jgi:hypothetical protein
MHRTVERDAGGVPKGGRCGFVAAVLRTAEIRRKERFTSALLQGKMSFFQSLEARTGEQAVVYNSRCDVRRPI